MTDTEKYKLFKKYLDDLEKDGKFCESTTIECDRGALNLKFNNFIVCNTSLCGNLVNPYQCNDMRFLQFAIEIVRISMAIAYDKKFSKKKIDWLIEQIDDVSEDGYPITPGDWDVMHEYNGFRELYSTSNGGQTICHNDLSKDGFKDLFIFWVLAKAPAMYKILYDCRYVSTSSIKFSAGQHRQIVDRLFNEYASTL